MAVACFIWGSFIWALFWQVARGGSPFQRQQHGVTTQKGKRAMELLGQREVPEGLTCLHDGVSSMQGVSGLQKYKVQQHLGVFFVLFTATRRWVSFWWVCKIGSKWLKICLFGLYINSCMWKFWFGSGGLKLTVLACCEEVNNVRINMQGPYLSHLCNILQVFSPSFYWFSYAVPPLQSWDKSSVFLKCLRIDVNSLNVW